jgi:hypothetical protein
MIIKILLILGILGVVVFALRGGGGTANLAVRRMAGVAFAAAATVSIMFPDLVTWMAHRVNVGRGTDLVLYVLVVVFLYVTIGLYQRISKLELHLADLTRALALLDAREGEASPRSDETDGKP